MPSCFVCKTDSNKVVHFSFVRCFVVSVRDGERQSIYLSVAHPLRDAEGERERENALNL